MWKGLSTYPHTIANHSSCTRSVSVKPLERVPTASLRMHQPRKIHHISVEPVTVQSATTPQTCLKACSWAASRLTDRLTSSSISCLTIHWPRWNTVQIEVKRRSRILLFLGMSAFMRWLGVSKVRALSESAAKGEAWAGIQSALRFNFFCSARPAPQENYQEYQLWFFWSGKPLGATHIFSHHYTPYNWSGETASSKQGGPIAASHFTPKPILICHLHKRLSLPPTSSSTH